MKEKSLSKVSFLLVVLFLGVFSVFMLCESVRLGFCSDQVIVVPDHYPKIGWAVGNASEGATIFVKSGVYLESHIVINRSISIVGENADDTVVDGEETAQFIFYVIANDVVIENFTLQNTDPVSFSPAVRLYNVTNVTVKNVITQNVFYGLQIRSSNLTKIMHCQVSASINSGIYLHEGSCNNTFSGNTIENNHIGIWIAQPTSEFNKIYHNNFINNSYQISTFGGLNYFDNGYPCGGNYWSDHAAPDLKFGSYQNETGSDGILDDGYPAGAPTPWDNYPLAHPLSKFEIEADDENFEIQLSTNSTLDSYEFNSEMKKLALFVSGYDGTNGSCRVSIPKELLSCDSLAEWNVSIFSDDTQILYRALEDENRTYIYFTYNHTDIGRIEIEGTKAIPEISTVTALILLLATTTTIVVAVESKR